MLKIIKISKNPKIKRKRKVVCVKKNVKRKTRRIKKKRVIRAKKNPPKKRYETIIVGYASGNTLTKKGKRLYFTGYGFSRDRDKAKVFPGDLAKSEAKRILSMLPAQIYGIKVETA